MDIYYREIFEIRLTYGNKFGQPSASIKPIHSEMS